MGPHCIAVRAEAALLRQKWVLDSAAWLAARILALPSYVVAPTIHRAVPHSTFMRANRR